MENKQWEFLEGKNVFIYPSANADDNGATNSEKNLAGISDKFAYKSFVVRRESDTKRDTGPLLVTYDSDSGSLEIANGEAVVEGYYINICGIESVNNGQGRGIKFKLNPEEGSDSYFILPSVFEEFIEVYREDFNKMFVKNEEGSWVRREDIPKGTKSPEYLHVILKLLRNATGNVRGDITERTKDFSGTLRVCKGMTLSVCTSQELLEIDSPYLDLAEIVIDPESSVFSSLVVLDIINRPSRYTFIDESQVVTSDGQTLREWVTEYVGQRLGHLNKLTYCTAESEKDPCSIDSEVILDENGFRVNRYDIVEGEYDSQGDCKKTLNGDYNKTYSVDEVNRRTHVSSSSFYSPDDSDELRIRIIAHQVDRRDISGTHICTESDGTNATENMNGTSKLLARADHNHDTRYIINKRGCSPTNPQDFVQEIATGLRVLPPASSRGSSRGPSVFDTFYSTYDKRRDLSSKSVVLSTQSIDTLIRLFNLWDVDQPDSHIDRWILTAGQAPDGNPFTDIDGDLFVSGNIESTGTIVGSKVYNAVWNDYAELFKKDVEGQEIEPGTVICKVKGRDTYAPSSETNRKLAVGVCSDTYGHLLGGDEGLTEEENLKKYIPVALAGRVYVKVEKGIKIEEGDILAPSCNEEGCAVKMDEYNPQYVIGKALESTDGTKDKILMIVSLR